MNTVIRTEELIDAIDGTDVMVRELACCTGCVSGAISEVARSHVSIATRDLELFYRENKELCRQAWREGATPSPAEYFDANPQEWVDSYIEDVAARTWYEKNCDGLYRRLGDSMRLAVLQTLEKAGIYRIDAGVWRLISTGLGDVSGADHIEYVINDALTDAVTEAVVAEGIEPDRYGLDGWDTEDGRCVLVYGGAGPLKRTRR
jgi:hypothetical protein